MEHVLDLSGLELFWTKLKATFAKRTELPAASNTNPVMDGAAAVGSSAAYARADHVHPSDKSRLKQRHLPTTGSYLSTSKKYLKLTMPAPSNAWMMTLGIVVYSGYVAEVYYIGGYNYYAQHQTAQWYTPSVIYLSTSSVSVNVYFGKNDQDGGDGKLWVAVPLSSYSHATLLENSSNSTSFDIDGIEYSILDANPENWDATTNGAVSTVKTVVGTGALASKANDADVVHKANAETITGVKTFSVGAKLQTATSWTSSDRAIPFSQDSDKTIIQYTNVDSSKGLTFNPNTGALKAKSFVTRGGTSAKFVKGDGSLDDTAYAPLNSPNFTGTPQAPTPGSNAGDHEIATVDYVKTKVAAEGIPIIDLT